MRQITILTVATLLLGTVSAADAQWRVQDRRIDRQDVARAQGVPPGQLPPANQCRVWYDNRSPGRQPSATSCRQAETIAARDRNARVIYGENVYLDSRSARGVDPYGTRDDRAVRRDGRVRDPRVIGGVLDPRRRDGYYRTEAFENGYRDGLTKGREDGEDEDRYEPNRHSWYRAATRGYDDDESGSRAQYQARYRDGFTAGYAEGYRVYARR